MNKTIDNTGVVTIEAAVIVPLFTFVIVLIIKTSIGCLDSEIINCISDRTCINAEFNSYKNSKYDYQILKDYEKQGNVSLSMNIVEKNINLEIKDDLVSIKTNFSSIDKNNPMQYVRLIDVAKKLLKKVDKE